MPMVNIVQTELPPRYHEMARALIEPYKPSAGLDMNSIMAAYKGGQSAGNEAFGGVADTVEKHFKGQQPAPPSWQGMFGGQAPLNLTPPDLSSAAASQADPAMFGQIQQYDPTQFNPASLIGLW